MMIRNEIDRERIRGTVAVLGKRFIFTDGIGAAMYRCPYCGWLTERLELYLSHVDLRHIERREAA